MNRPAPGTWPKRCGCGVVHWSTSWETLKLVGTASYEPGELLELRNCGCGSTLAIQIIPVRSTPPSGGMRVVGVRP